MRTLRHRPCDTRRARGVALLEVMIALTVLTIGLLGMLRLQILGITANGGARTTTFASQLATELAGALERLQFEDGHLTGATGTSPPSPFGRLLGGDMTAAHVRTWSDSDPIPGVRPDSALPTDPAGGTGPQYVRRWSVWDYFDNTPTGAASAKIIAVSVIFTERGNPVPRELVVLTHKPNAGLAVSYVAGYR